MRQCSADALGSILAEKTHGHASLLLKRAQIGSASQKKRSLL
jgi:hypothetical protein